MAVVQMAFDTPPKAQSSSPLLRLPAELRLMILGHLLFYTGGVICAYTHIGDEHESTPSGQQLLREYRTSLQRSAQVLRTCQQLYIDAHPLLYEKNTMQIHTQGGAIHVLDAFLNLPGVKEAEEGAKLDLLELAKSIEKQYLQREFKEDAEQIIRTYPALRKFQNFSIQVEYYDQEDVFMACRMLRNLLHNKHVTFMPQPQGLSDCDAVDFLEPCAFLKCESFNFGNFDDIEHLRVAVTGRTSVPDTLPMWLNFSNNFLVNLPHNIDESFECRHDQDYEKLKQHMLDYDMDAYRVQQRFLMERALEWNQEWAVREIDSEIYLIDHKRDTANRAITRVLGSLYPSFGGIIDE